MPALLLNPIVWLAALLALSFGGNVLLYKLHTRDLVIRGELKQAANDAAAAARACSAGVARLREEARERERAHQADLRQADEQAKEIEHRALATLQARPADEDLCKAAAVLSRQKLERRQAIDR